MTKLDDNIRRLREQLKECPPNQRDRAVAAKRATHKMVAPKKAAPKKKVILTSNDDDQTSLFAWAEKVSVNKIVDQIQQTRRQLMSGARAVSAYFKTGGGIPANDHTERAPLAWTSDEQKQRSREFQELAKKLARKNRAA